MSNSIYQRRRFKCEKLLTDVSWLKKLRVSFSSWAESENTWKQLEFCILMAVLFYGGFAIIPFKINLVPFSWIFMIDHCPFLLSPVWITYKLMFKDFPVSRACYNQVKAGCTNWHITDGGGTRVINHGLSETKKAKLWNTWTSLRTNPLARSSVQVKLAWKLRNNLFK